MPLNWDERTTWLLMCQGDHKLTGYQQCCGSGSGLFRSLGSESPEILTFRKVILSTYKSYDKYV